MLSQRLTSLNSFYGEYPAHNGLWEMALKTRHSALERMALVPRVLEARGLDITPVMIRKLESVGDHETVEILNVILREEEGHVKTGTKWFRYLCEKENLNPDTVFISLLDKYQVSTGRSHLHVDARKRAGFNETELKALAATST